MCEPRTLLLGCLLFVTFAAVLRETSTVPSVCFKSSSRTPPERPDASTINTIASKAIGAMVKVASYVWKWLPELPECVRPPPPTLRIKPKFDCTDDDDDDDDNDSSSFEEFD